MNKKKVLLSKHLYAFVSLLVWKVHYTTIFIKGQQSDDSTIK